MPDLTNNQLLDAMRQEFATKADIANFVTKDDLKDDLEAMATKYNLKDMATKDDLKNFATKDDIKNMATKDDLKGLPTKNDLKNFATKDDIKATRYDIARLERKLDDHKAISTQHHLKILEDIGQLNQQFTGLAESQKGLRQKVSRLRIITE